VILFGGIVGIFERLMMKPHIQEYLFPQKKRLREFFIFTPLTLLFSSQSSCAYPLKFSWNNFFNSCIFDFKKSIFFGIKGAFHFIQSTAFFIILITPFFLSSQNLFFDFIENPYVNHFIHWIGGYFLGGSLSHFIVWKIIQKYGKLPFLGDFLFYSLNFIPWWILGYILYQMIIFFSYINFQNYPFIGTSCISFIAFIPFFYHMYKNTLNSLKRDGIQYEILGIPFSYIFSLRDTLGTLSLFWTGFWEFFVLIPEWNQIFYKNNTFTCYEYIVFMSFVSSWLFIPHILRSIKNY
jgi:hypothetical protein